MQEKKVRLVDAATKKAAGQTVTSKKPVVVKYGLNHVTTLVEQKKAQLVVIANDVDPIELVCWLPALCRKCDVPYCIVKSKARLGQVVHKKTASVLAVTGVKPEDAGAFSKLVEAVNSNFLERYEDLRKHWGGGHLGLKSTHSKLKKEKTIAREEAKRLGN